ncbi:hypothetical protein C7271_08830 [filamentous cyanobacterium CCP5]|nr:hypothetical protein C7271_08830 [filamentous cyanobacterium CCP5]
MEAIESSAPRWADELRAAKLEIALLQLSFAPYSLWMHHLRCWIKGFSSRITRSRKNVFELRMLLPSREIVLTESQMNDQRRQKNVSVGMNVIKMKLISASS